jgi:AbrB family looped-hinge helix DNA binding protein
MTEALERVARITSKGQVTLPAEIRRALQVRDGDSVIFRSAGGVVTVASARKPTLAELLAGFDPEKHRRGAEERPWDDTPRGRESL